MNVAPPTPPPYPFGPIQFPADHYFHPDAPAEWWWHTGTLMTSDNKTFGFEINAAGFGTSLFSQIMLTDVGANAHYSQNAKYDYHSQWAAQDTTQDWYVSLPYAPSGIGPLPKPPYARMNGPKADPTQSMRVQAAFVDSTTSKVVTFDLTLSQQGQPLLVWGTGIQPSSPGGLQTNNCYYSLTRLQASGTVTLDQVQYSVTGVTWMDHEYGYFGSQSNPVKWILQGMQLNNGVCISNYALVGGTQPALIMDQPSPSQATVQFSDGTTYYVNSFLTPRGNTWVSPVTGKLYYMQFQVDIPSFNATFMVSSLVDAQEFVSDIEILHHPIAILSAIYEGVASVTGQFMGSSVSGTAWNEQTAV